MIKKIKTITICFTVIMCLLMFGMSREKISADIITELNEDMSEVEITPSETDMVLGNAEPSPVPVAYSIDANSSEEKKSKPAIKKESPHGYASVSVNGVMQSFSVVYVLVKSNNQEYQSNVLQCYYSYRDLQNLNYETYPGENFDSKDAKGRSFCVYARYDIGSRVASGTISGEVIP